MIDIPPEDISNLIKEINSTPVNITKTKIKITANIYLDNWGKLEPQEDITSLETAHLMILLMNLTFTGSHYSVDIDGYIKEHKLERHFKK